MIFGVTLITGIAILLFTWNKLSAGDMFHVLILQYWLETGNEMTVPQIDGCVMVFNPMYRNVKYVIDTYVCTMFHFYFKLF